MRDNNGTGTQQEVCKFLVDYMGVLEKQMVEQEQRWIPVSERFPEEYGEYMITWTTSNSLARKEGFLGTAEYELSDEYDHENNRFKGEWILEDYIKNYSDVKVTAWMPLPQPYKAESEDKHGKI
jgi:hypothetical protein